MAVSIGAGAAVLYEFSGDAEAVQFLRAGAWFGAAALALVMPLMLLARRRASALLLYRAFVIVLMCVPVLAGVLLAYWLELGHFLISGAMLLIVFASTTPLLLWKAAQRLRAKWQRNQDKLLAAWYSPELGAVDIDQVQRRVEDDRAFYDPRNPGSGKHIALGALLLFIVVSRELYHFHRVVAFLAAAGSLWCLAALARFLLTQSLLARRVAALGRPMTPDEIRSRKPRRQKRKR